MKIDMKQPILDKNDAIARELRERFAEHHVYVVDLLASPGSGKTSTILATIDALRDEFNIAVIEGDIASSVDAEKIKAQGIAAVQINTGGACHLESAMIKRAIDVLDLERLDLIIVENVGNLVCPTDFDLGENAKVMILSVPEGDDKPLKYPGVFQVSEAVILNKVDTMPVFNFNQEAFEESVNQLNPQAPIFPLSATTAKAWRRGRAGSLSASVRRNSTCGVAAVGQPARSRPAARVPVLRQSSLRCGTARGTPARGLSGRRWSSTYEVATRLKQFAGILSRITRIIAQGGSMKAGDKYQACVDALAAFAKGAGFSQVVIGLSGGIDSSVTAVMAVDAFGAKNVHGVLLPGPYSTGHSIDDALALAENLGIESHTVSICEPFEAFEQVIRKSYKEKLEGLASENTQARCRMVILMALSNANRWMLVNTGNKSEAAMGYSTLYGDTAGAFAPLGGLYKTDVYEVGRWRNEPGARGG